MGLFDTFPSWLSMRSRAEEERQLQELDACVFPHGLKEREMVRDMLAEIMPPKFSENENLYLFVTAKECYVKMGGGQDGLQLAFKALQRTHWVKPRDVCTILALVEKASSLQTLDDFPAADTVRAHADVLQSGV